MLIRNNTLYLKYKINNFNQKKVVLCAPEFTSADDLSIDLPQNWDLLAGNMCIDSQNTLHPPTSWSYTQACSTITKPSQWPEPFVSHQAHVDNNTLKTIYPFNDNRSGLEIILGKIPCLIITDTNFYCTNNEVTMYKEHFECIFIINGTNSTLIDSVRSTLRPRYLIVINSPKSKSTDLRNVFYLSGSHIDIVFNITSSNTLTFN